MGGVQDCLFLIEVVEEMVIYGNWLHQTGAGSLEGAESCEVRGTKR